MSLPLCDFSQVMDVPTWAKGLKQVGLYYEGYIENTNLIRQKHLAATVSSFGIRRSRSNTNSTEKT